MVRVDIDEAGARLSELITRAESGEEVFITRPGKPATRLVVEKEKRPLSEFTGSMKGEIWIADDFDEFGPELQEMFGLEDG